MNDKFILASIFSPPSLTLNERIELDSASKVWSLFPVTQQNRSLFQSIKLSETTFTNGEM